MKNRKGAVWKQKQKDHYFEGRSEVYMESGRWYEASEKKMAN